MALPNLTHENRAKFISQNQHEADQSHETFVRHFRDKYGDTHSLMPVWMATEIMTFGCVLTFYKCVVPQIRKDVAPLFGVHDTVLGSWLFTLNTIRNICAHHSRLWNRELGLKPKIPLKDPRWQHPFPIPNYRIFGILTILKHCLYQIAPQSHWPHRVKTLLAEFPQIPLTPMGFPPNWTECPIWNAANSIP